MGFYHLGNGNREGARRLFDRALVAPRAVPAALRRRRRRSAAGVGRPLPRRARRRGRAAGGGAAAPRSLEVAARRRVSARRLDRRALFASLRPPAPGGGHWVRVHRPAMACRFEVVLDSDDARHVPAARAALDEVDAIEAALTYFRDTSELQRLNRDAAAGPVAVESRAVRAPFSLPRDARRERGSLRPDVDARSAARGGSSSARGACPSRPRSRPRGRGSASTRCVLDEEARTVRFARPGAGAEPRLRSARAGRSTGSRPACASAVGRARARLGRRQQPARVGSAAVGGSPHLGRRDARDAAPARRGDRHERRRRAARRGRGPALRPRHRPAHRLAGGGRAQRDRDRRRRRRSPTRSPRRSSSAGKRWPARSARRGRARWRSSRSSASRAPSRVIGDRDGVGIEPAAGFSLRDERKWGRAAEAATATRPARAASPIQAAASARRAADDVERHRRHRRGERDRQHPRPDDAAGDAPLHGREPLRRADADDRAGDRVRRRDRDAERASRRRA